jgi:hypothetical protein
VYHLLPQPLLLTPPLTEPTQWEAIEYHNPGLDRGIVYCFRALAPESEKVLHIRGLDRAHVYKVTFEDSGEMVRIRSGESVTVHLAEQNRSELLWVEQI